MGNGAKAEATGLPAVHQEDHPAREVMVLMDQIPAWVVVIGRNMEATRDEAASLQAVVMVPE